MHYPRDGPGGLSRLAWSISGLGEHAAMSRDPNYLAHKEWIGFVQPTGLVVSIPALLQAQAYID